MILRTQYTKLRTKRRLNGSTALGRACKRLIDAARAGYVRDVLGLPGAEVRHFVEREVTTGGISVGS